MLTRFKLTTDQVRLAVVGGATILTVGAIGTTAALATSKGTAVTQADASATGERLLTIQTAAPPPLVMPRPATPDERLVVLVDAPADLAYDGDLQGSLDAAAMRVADAAEARRTAAETAGWEKESAKLQAQIDAAGRPAYEPAALESAKPKIADAEVTAAAGDTRPTTTVD